MKMLQSGLVIRKMKINHKRFAGNSLMCGGVRSFV